MAASLRILPGPLSVSREANFLVDAITDVDFQYDTLHIWDTSLWSCACRALLFDCIGTGYSRGDSI